MKKVIHSWIIIGILLLSFFVKLPVDASSLNKRRYPSQVMPSWTTLFLDRFKGIILIKPSKREHTFFSSPTTATRLAKNNNKSTAILNAWYFRRQQGKFFPAGIHALDPTAIHPHICTEDKNLCWFVELDTLTIKEWLTITKTPTITAWPILLRDGIINPEITERYSHRQKKAERTILLNTKKWPIFLVTKKQYTLPKIASYIAKTFGSGVTAINLDGWSSTSLRTDNPLFTKNPEKSLPTFFIVY